MEREGEAAGGRVVAAHLVFCVVGAAGESPLVWADFLREDLR